MYIYKITFFLGIFVIRYLLSDGEYLKFKSVEENLKMQKYDRKDRKY